MISILILTIRIEITKYLGIETFTGNNLHENSREFCVAILAGRNKSFFSQFVGCGYMFTFCSVSVKIVLNNESSLIWLNLSRNSNEVVDD